MRTGAHETWRQVEVRERANDVVYDAFAHMGSVRHYAGAWMVAREAAIAADRANLFFGKEAVNVPRESRRRGPASPDVLKRLSRSLRSKSTGTSKYFGVSRRPNGMFRATICVDRKAYEIANFTSELEAARAYDRVAVAMHGAYARLNFPNERPKPATIAEIRREVGGRPREDRSSQYLGVNFVAAKKKYSAAICVDRRVWSLGHWDRERDAAIAYDRAALYFRGKNARRNFPKLPVEPASPEQIQREQRARAKAKMTSRYEGVSQAGSGWVAFIYLGGGRIPLGTWPDEESAALAYDRAMLYIFGADVERNFPRRKLAAATPEVLRREARAAVRRRFTSKYEGVSRPAGSDKCYAHISVGGRAGGKTGHLGVFDDDEEAARAYDRAARHLGRDPAKLNFPLEETKPASIEELTDAAWQRYKEKTTSRYTGVFWSSSKCVWCAQINVDGVLHRLGEFEEEAAAARAYDRAAFRYRGDAQRPQWINFPEEWGAGFAGRQKMRA